ncbi:MAG: hypothetical protein CSA22_02520 [Deltaproteobacteria bacterium]|nr:MAG: hypothetical protein CSA22_02520 [Deltaproteobacteria bacterium]
MNASRKKMFQDETGAVMVEFCLIAPVFFVLIGLMLVMHDFLSSCSDAQIDLKNRMRKSMHSARKGPFRKMPQAVAEVRIEIPGNLRKFAGHDRMTARYTLDGYGGCYQGLGISIYAKRRRIRKIAF